MALASTFLSVMNCWVAKGLIDGYFMDYPCYKQSIKWVFCKVAVIMTSHNLALINNQVSLIDESCMVASQKH